MANQRIEQLVAGINMWLVSMYHRDLTEYFDNHDEGRFSRMVVDQGKSLATANPAGWAQHIANLAPRVIAYHRGELVSVYSDLQRWGVQIDMSIFEVHDET